MKRKVLPASCRQRNLEQALPSGRRQHLVGGHWPDRSRFRVL